MRVYFTDRDQPVIDQAISVKCKDVTILNCFLDVEAVPFNKGFFSVDITYFFGVKLSAVSAPMCPPHTVMGIATFQKKVILYGSEGCVKTFSSDNELSNSRMHGHHGNHENNTCEPRALLQVVDPICLSTKICECRCRNDDEICELPPSICSCFDGDFTGVSPTKAVFVTLGLFTIVQLERKVQLMIPAYDFCIPDKECVSTTDDPCKLFQKIKFPTDEFFPPNLADLDD